MKKKRFYIENCDEKVQSIDEVITVFKNIKEVDNYECLAALIIELSNDEYSKEIIKHKLSILYASLNHWKNIDLNEHSSFPMVFSNNTLQNIFDTMFEVLIYEELLCLSFSSKSIMSKRDIELHQRIISLINETLIDINNCNNSIDSFIDVLHSFKRFLK